MRISRYVLAAALALALTALAGACGGDAAVPFSLIVEPEFVYDAVPGSATGVLVALSNEADTDAPVALTAAAEGAEVRVDPPSIGAGEVAEVTVVAAPVTAEQDLELVITGRRGGLEATASRSFKVFAWEDDRGPYARQLLGLFTSWLAENQPDLGITPSTEFSGSMVAPGLLIVSHYLFRSEEWEIGLSWHVMVPPDDWAEIYLRPRDELHPTLAFRLASQDAALNEGRLDIAPVSVPEEVVR